MPSKRASGRRGKKQSRIVPPAARSRHGNEVVVSHHDRHFKLGLAANEASDLVEYLKSL
jgi:hypothetical protein